MSILVRNLARTTTETELKALFETYGEVQACSIVMDKETGLSKGFGFVDMLHPKDADAAIAALNGTKVAGSKIRVKLSNPEPSNQDSVSQEATTQDKGREQKVPSAGQNVWGSKSRAKND